MLLDLLKSKKSGVLKSLNAFANAAKVGEITSRKDEVTFVFLCGGNNLDGTTSARRQALLRFSERGLQNCKFFIAEKFFNAYLHEFPKKNLLDAEALLSEFADHVLIVLESAGSLCELGAFAYSGDLRKKLIVINDLAFKDVPSFISKGPIQAIAENGNEKRVLYYKMVNTGHPSESDAIGSTFAQLQDLFQPTSQRKLTKFAIKDLEPAGGKITRHSLSFVHDLVHICGPLNLSELVEILKHIAGKKDYNTASEHLAFRICSRLISLFIQNFKVSTQVQFEVFSKCKSDSSLETLAVASRQLYPTPGLCQY